MDIWEKYKLIIVYAAALIISLFLILFSRAQFALSVKQIYQFGLYPIQNGAQKVSRSIQSLYSGISRLSSKEKELVEAQKKLQYYENVSVELKEVRRENRILRELLEQRKEIRYHTVVASVVAKDPQNFYSTIIIDKGKHDGIKVNMPVVAYHNDTKRLVDRLTRESVREISERVVGKMASDVAAEITNIFSQEIKRAYFEKMTNGTTEEIIDRVITSIQKDDALLQSMAEFIVAGVGNNADFVVDAHIMDTLSQGIVTHITNAMVNEMKRGVVGKIIEVGAHYSKVLPLTDERCKIGVRLQSPRNAGILSGQVPKSLLCRLDYINRNADVTRGDMVVTCGMGGVFPEGLAVGTVFRVQRKGVGPFQEIDVKPIIDFSILEHVYVIKKTTDEELSRMIERGDTF